MANVKNNFFIEDFYDYSYTPIARYGWGKPGLSQIENTLEKGLARYEILLRQFSEYSNDLLSISVHQNPALPQQPNWVNGFFPGLDALSLYGMIAVFKPETFLEIGSGNSTKFAFAAKQAHSQHTNIVSIDPSPRVEIDGICDNVVRIPLQNCDKHLFMELKPGDILFLDGSHRVLQNSDVTIFFLEIFPLLSPGVIVHIHDIAWPFDYPDEWAGRMYSEQYMLGMLLLYAEESIEVLLPVFYISMHQNLMLLFENIWSAPELEGIEPRGASFWFQKKH